MELPNLTVLPLGSENKILKNIETLFFFYYRLFSCLLKEKIHSFNRFVWTIYMLPNMNMSSVYDRLVINFQATGRCQLS